MAITLTAAQLGAAMRLGSSTEETAEATRLLAYATEAISKHLGTAYAETPEAVVNEAAIRLCGYLFDKPYASGGVAFANAMQNSGAAVMLLPYRVHRAGSIGEAAVESAPSPQAGSGALGLRELGSESVTINAPRTWTATTLPAPSSRFAGISVLAPDGSGTPINLFPTSTLSGAAVASAESGQVAEQYSIDTTSGGVVVFASMEVGDHVVRLYEVG